jgi:hypothetical protein
VFAVSPAQPTMLAVCERHGVEAVSLGTFTGDGVLRVRSGQLTVLELDTHFLHDGRPQRSMSAVLPTPMRTPTCRAAVRRPRCHAAGTARAPQHRLEGTHHPPLRPRDPRRHRGAPACRRRSRCTRRRCGAGRARPATRPRDRHRRQPVVRHHRPRVRMAHAVVDEAIRNVVAVGADPSSIALLDNFSWGDPRRPSTLGELVAAVQGCCAAATAHRAPFVSGKDSLNNEYLGSDGARHAVPPTLVITAIAHVPNAGPRRHSGPQAGRQRPRARGRHRRRVRRQPLRDGRGRHGSGRPGARTPQRCTRALPLAAHAAAHRSSAQLPRPQ